MPMFLFRIVTTCFLSARHLGTGANCLWSRQLGRTVGRCRSPWVDRVSRPLSVGARTSDCLPSLPLRWRSGALDWDDGRDVGAWVGRMHDGIVRSKNLRALRLSLRPQAHSVTAPRLRQPVFVVRVRDNQRGTGRACCGLCTELHHATTSPTVQRSTCEYLSRLSSRLRLSLSAPLPP